MSGNVFLQPAPSLCWIEELNITKFQIHYGCRNWLCWELIFSLVSKMCSGPSCFLSKAFSGVWLQQRLVVVLNGFVRCRMAPPQMLAASQPVCALSWVN